MLKTVLRITSTISGTALVALCLTAPSHAVDGVIEINQAKAEAGGVTATDAPGFPVTIDAPGSYVLTSNLTSGTSGILISAPDVTIDLNGFSVLGPVACSYNESTPPTCTGSTSGLGIQASTSAVRTTVKNGGVSGFTGGIQLWIGGRIENMNVTNIGALSNIGAVFCARYCMIKNSQVRLNASDGIVVSINAIIEGNIIEDNGGYGIRGGAGIVRNNQVQNNAQAFIWGGGVIHDNMFLGNDKVLNGFCSFIVSPTTDDALLIYDNTISHVGANCDCAFKMTGYSQLSDTVINAPNSELQFDDGGAFMDTHMRAGRISGTAVDDSGDGAFDKGGNLPTLTNACNFIP